MRRREFMLALGGAAATWPLAAHAQQPGKMPVIGVLGASTAAAAEPLTLAFNQRLRDHGWIEGKTAVLEYRWGDGRLDRYIELAGELVRLKVDVIAAAGTATAIAAKRATSVIPIVFAGATDPVGVGLVASLARPGGNVTGVSSQQVDLVGKRIELLREIIPGFRQLAILVNVENPNNVLESREVQSAARTIGFEATPFEIRGAKDIAPAFAALKGRADAVYIPPDAFFITNRSQVSALALDARVATIYGFREDVEAGGLLSYGPHLPEIIRRSADYVDKILRGAKAGDIPVEQPTKFELVVNLKTARALGLQRPDRWIARADEVIE